MEDEPSQSHPLPPSKMSKVPSWISLGFVLGAFFVWALPKPSPPPVPVPPVQTAEVPRPAPAPVKLTTIEAVFAAWGGLAVWDGDTTEVGFWNPETEGVTEFYEVKRIGAGLFFRTIPKLTRRVIRHGRPPPTECPLQFTESLEQYNEWREQGRVERPAPPPLPSSSDLPRVATPVNKADKP